MPNFEVDYEYSVREYGTHVVNADDKEDAERLAREYVEDLDATYSAITIEEVREVTA